MYVSTYICIYICIHTHTHTHTHIHTHIITLSTRASSACMSHHHTYVTSSHIITLSTRATSVGWQPPQTSAVRHAARWRTSPPWPFFFEKFWKKKIKNKQTREWVRHQTMEAYIYTHIHIQIHYTCVRIYNTRHLGFSPWLGELRDNQCVYIYNIYLYVCICIDR